ncbi:MAG: hypothetical protein JSS49_19635 [Planctomycetes bacterium]|nr:hypothetical protein [Planctomycetota bacterium]
MTRYCPSILSVAVLTVVYSGSFIVAQEVVHETPPRDLQTPPKSADDDQPDPLRATVAIRVTDGTSISQGSGTIIESSAGRTTILTGDFFKRTTSSAVIKVELFTSEKSANPEIVTGRVLRTHPEAALALISISYPQQLPTVRLMSADGEPVAVTDQLNSYGCTNGNAPSRESVRVSSINKYQGAENLECTGLPQSGRAGGGLFRRNELVGVCIAADPQSLRGVYSSLKPIARLLIDADLKHLAPTPLKSVHTSDGRDAHTVNHGDTVAPKNQWVNIAPPGIDTGSAAIAEQEALAVKIAEQLRSQANRLGWNHPDVERSRQSLNKALASALDLKFQVEREQLGKLEERLSRLRNQLQFRQDSRDKILQRRTQELLEGGALKWNPASPDVEPQKINVPNSSVANENLTEVTSESPHADSIETDLGIHPEIIIATVRDTEPYRLRRKGHRDKTALANGASAKSERAVEAGLRWLASVQEPAGNWTSVRHEGAAAMKDPMERDRLRDSAAESDTVLLEFTAIWCQPCQQMRPIVSRLQRQSFSIHEVDVDAERELALRFGVKSIPCFVLIAGGQEIDRVSGVTSEQQLKSMLNRLPKPVARSHEGLPGDAGITGLAVLAFLGAGYTHDEGPYKEVVLRAINWLITQQKSANGYLGGPATRYDSMYCHAMATAALAEAQAMQTDPDAVPGLREAIRNGVRLICSMQNDDGGWRYGKGGKSDLSMTGWQLTALWSASHAGVRLPEATMENAIRFLAASSQGPRGGLAGYLVTSPPTLSMTAEALYCRQLYCVKNSNPASQAAIEYLLARPPRLSEQDEWYWYFGSLAMFQCGEAPFNTWNGALRDVLVDLQTSDGTQAGSWPPKGKWAGIGGRVFSTAMSTMILEVYYRYPRIDGTCDDLSFAPDNPTQSASRAITFGTTQVEFVAPKGMQIVIGQGAIPTRLTCPARYNFPRKKAAEQYSLTLFPDRPAGESTVSMVLDVLPADTRIESFLERHSVPIRVTDEDREQLQSNHRVTKVVYLPRENTLVDTQMEILVSTRLDPGIDPVQEAGRRGSIILVCRLSKLSESHANLPE